MAEFIVVRIGIRRGGSWSHAIAIWEPPSERDVETDFAFADLVLDAVAGWFKRNGPENPGRRDLYQQSYGITLEGRYADEAHDECRILALDDPERFKSCPAPKHFGKGRRHVR